MYIIFGALLLVIVLTGVRWFMTADVRQLAKAARTGLIVMAFTALILLGCSGRLPTFFTGILALMPFYPYARRLWQENIAVEDSVGPQAPDQSLFILNRQQALDILGLIDPIDDKQIIAAHRRIIQKIHPDKGGSDFLASQVNRAKDTLLNNVQSPNIE